MKYKMKYKFLISMLNLRIKYSSVRAVAKKANVSASTISRVANGHTPDLDSYFKLCKYFEVDAPFSIGFKPQNK